VTDYKQHILKHSLNPNNHNITRYVTFIEHCKTLVLNDKYTETHHIVPKSFGGLDNINNLITLSARHHYIAHLLLAKGTNSPKMIKALHLMVYSKTGDVCRSYKITNRVYAYLRESHAKVVSNYSKGTVVAKNLNTLEIKRIPKELFDKYNGIIYVALAKGRKDSIATVNKKREASKRPRIVCQQSIVRSQAACKYSYCTPKGFCNTSKELLTVYPTFTKNTLTIINNDVIITHKFASIHNEFSTFVGKSFKEFGITKLIKDNTCHTLK